MVSAIQHSAVHDFRTKGAGGGGVEVLALYSTYWTSVMPKVMG